MSRFANSALLGGGVRARVWIREQRKIKRRSKALPKLLMVNLDITRSLLYSWVRVRRVFSRPFCLLHRLCMEALQPCMVYHIIRGGQALCIVLPD